MYSSTSTSFTLHQVQLTFLRYFHQYSTNRPWGTHCTLTKYKYSTTSTRGNI